MSWCCNTDIVVCLDVSDDMKWQMSEIKRQLKDIPDAFFEYAREYGFDKQKLRIRLITFSDFESEGADAIHETEFFEYPEQNEEYFAFIDGIKTGGGGDKPENALEALALAIKSKWTTGGDRRRHMVLMLTNAPAHPLQYRADCEGYPEGMPKDLEELKTWWEFDQSSYEECPFEGSYDIRFSRLLIYSPPDKEPWDSFLTWDNCLVMQGDTFKDRICDANILQACIVTYEDV